MRKNLQKINQGLSFVALMSASMLGNAQCPTPTSVTATPSIICAGTTASLNATAIGASINWYTVPSGGSAIGSSASGANFTLVGATTTTYYAESFQPIMPLIVAGGGGGIDGSNNYAGTHAVITSTGVAGESNPGSGGVAGADGGDYTYIGNGNNTARGGRGFSFNISGSLGQNGTSVNTQTTSGTWGLGGGGGSVGSGYCNCGGGGGGYSGGGSANINADGGGGGSFNSGTNQNNITMAGTGNGTVTIAASSGTTNFAFTGALQVYTVPVGVSQISITAIGAKGGSVSTNSGGLGTSMFGVFAVTAGQTLAVVVGGQGNAGTNTSGGGGASGVGTGTACTSGNRTAIVLTVNPLPTLTVNSGSICSGNSFTISPSGAASYTYQGGNAVVSPTTNTNYTVVGTSSLGCVSSTVTSSVTVNALPLPTISVNSGSICAGTSFTMVPSGASTFTFQGGNAVVSPTANATYTVVGTNSVGCVSATFATSSISVTAAPSVSVSGTPSICVGQSATLTASGANTYSWNTGASTSSVVVNPTITTSYTITGTSSVTGCSGTTTISLLVSPCTSINENVGVFTDLNLYPNPNTGVFNIELPVAAELMIQNSVGELIYTENLNAGNAAINIQSLSNGLYFIQLKNKDSKATYKIIKQ